MTRVATVPLQRIVSGGIQSAQQAIAISQTKLATGKKAGSFAALGTESVRNLSAHTLAARHLAYGDVANRLGATMALYDAHIGSIDSAASSLRGQILNAIGTGDSGGLQDAIGSAFGQFRGALNASVNGVPLFGGAQTGEPFVPGALVDLVGLPIAAAFANDQVRASARIGDGVDVRYGITADEVGGTLFAAFRALAEAGPIGDKPTAAQTTALQDAIGQIDAGLTMVRSANASNGRRQAQAETMATRAGDRNLLLTDLISQNEDADLGQIAIDLAQNKAVLQASYSVFTQLSGLSLANYLR